MPEPKPQPERVGLPGRYFLYTLDQVALLLGMDERSMRRAHVYFYGHDSGAQPPSRMLARDISGDDSDRPDWRIAEGELVRWLRAKGFRVYERGWAIK